VKVLGWTALVALVFVMTSLLAFWVAVHPPRITIPLRPADVGLDVEDVTVLTDDGLRLAAWLRRGSGEAGVVLLHGYPADKADMLPMAAALAPRFTTLLLDQRYFGASEGRVTTLGHRERRDLSRAIDLLEARGVRRIGVFGFSYGGAVALLGAADDARIQAVAAYAPFADLAALAHDLYGWLWLLRHPFVQLTRLWSRVFLGADITRPAPVDAAARLTVPVWLVASRGDEQIAVHHAERLAAVLAANPRAEVDLTLEGGHNTLPADFGRRLARFFERHLDAGG
jgi:ABC-2 type transport system ATP-binding protein